MIKEIRIKNWKSFGQATLYLDPLTVMIGTNASGKSNVLDGIEFLSRVVKGIELQAALNGDVGLPGIRGGSGWAALKPGNEFTIEVLVQSEFEENVDYLYGITVSTSPEVNNCFETLESITYKENGEISKATVFHAGKSSNNDDHELHISVPDKKDLIIFDVALKRKAALLGKVLGYGGGADNAISSVVSALEKIFILDPIPTLMRDYAPFSNTLKKDASNLAGVLAALPKEQKNWVEEVMSSYATQLPERDIRKVWAEPVGRLQKAAMLYCEEQWVSNEPPSIVDAEGMSDGTLRFLGILTALLTRPEGSLIVIEEVDNGLHPSRAGLLLKMLKEIGAKRKIDVLVTTHNPALLDALGPEMVPFVVIAHRDPKIGQSKLTLLENIRNLPKLLASGLIGKVATKGEFEKSLAEGMGDEQ